MLNAQPQLATAGTVQQVLEVMGGVLQDREAEGRGTALDGMGRTKDGVELLGIRRLDIQRQQQALHLGQQLLRLLEEGVVKLTDIHACSRWLSLRYHTGSGAASVLT